MQNLTSIRSESMTVCKRCATVKTVHSLNLSRIVRWINASVCGSTFAVASSSTRTLLLRRIARARQINWRCPTLKLLPASVTTKSSDSIDDLSSTWKFNCRRYEFGYVVTMIRLTSSNDLHKASSEYKWKGSKLLRTVELNKTGSCGIIDTWDRKLSNDITPVSIPSISTFPSIVDKRNRAPINDDLPAPVELYFR